ncbi:hypothetical protein niasHT_006506 [Heterodera trifolii]|uniref:Uncharacterized protein n=1 Tax=Heterodera trifolii TaxID=157864 RepID=A0ABD2LU89_9BILA
MMYSQLNMLTMMHGPCSALVCLMLLLLVFLVQLQLGAGSPLLSAAFRRTHMHKSGNDNGNNNRFDQLQQPLNHYNIFAGGEQWRERQQQKRHQHEKQLLLAMIKQYQEALISDRKAAAASGDADQQQQQQLNDNERKVDDMTTTGADQQDQKQQLEQGLEQGRDEPQMMGMRALHSWHGYWDWIEAETHSVYVFAFTYFGVITLLLVGMLILVSCCYMYDCLGCYEAEPSAQKWRSEGTGSTVFPMEPPPYGVIGGDMNKQQKSCSSSGRRWSSPIAEL